MSVAVVVLAVGQFRSTGVDRVVIVVTVAFKGGLAITVEIWRVPCTGQGHVHRTR